MLGKKWVRRGLGWVASVVLAMWAEHFYDGLKGTNKLHHPFESLGWLALAFIALALVVYGINHHDWWSMPLGVIIGVATALWSNKFFTFEGVGEIFVYFGFLGSAVILFLWSVYLKPSGERQRHLRVVRDNLNRGRERAKARLRRAAA